MQIYLDEGGDLGWQLNKPYRNGGSSQYLTIASLCVSADKRHMPKRLITEMYDRFGWKKNRERKWADLPNTPRLWFAEKAVELRQKHARDIKYLSITVKKENVRPHIRLDENILYNFMIKLSLIDEMARHPKVEFFPDARSIKIKSGNSLHEYLQTELWMTINAPTELITTPSNSSSQRNIQFADMLTGVVQSHFEDDRSQPWNVLRREIEHQNLFLY